VIPPRICDDIIKYALSQPEQIARTGDFDDKPLKNKDILNLQKKRKSDLVWLNDTWIYREIHPYIHRANKEAGWNFEWLRSESCQFTKYKLNQFYDWHSDGWNLPYNKPDTPEHGMVRKLSVTCQLTDGSEYTGGELEFDFKNYELNKKDKSKSIIQCKEILPKGSIIVFPSFVWHRVKPVTSGTRYSLVIWNLGYPFK
jgi:PKHD-type hydroxylase